MRVAAVVLSAMLTFASVAISAGAMVQDASPVPGQDPDLDLAAMALDSGDVPEGFFDDYSEWLLTPEAFSGFILGGEPVSTALEAVYQSFYFSNDEQVAIHNYLLAYSNSRAASADVDIVDATFLRPPLPDGTVDGPTTSPGQEIGDGTGTMTHVTYDTQAEGGPIVDVTALTFQRDRLVVGVAIERYYEPAGEGTPVVADDEAGEADVARAEELAMTLDERISAVTSGGSPEGIDLSLSATMLPIDVLAAPDTPVFTGYKSGVDLLRCGICGEENSLVAYADDALGGFARGLSVGSLEDGEPTPPWILVSVAEFASPEAALNVMDAMRAAPNDRPTAAPVPRGERVLVEDAAIPGVTDVLGFEAVFDTENPDAMVDSASVSFVHGSLLVSVDVLGGLPDGAAMDVAVDLATQQNECLVAGGTCQNLTVPGPLT